MTDIGRLTTANKGGCVGVKNKIIKKTTAYLVSFCIFMVTLVVIQASALVAQGDVNIRVSLSSGTSTVDFRVDRGSYSLIDENTGTTIGQPMPGVIWSIVRRDSGLDVMAGGQTIATNIQGPLAVVPHDLQALNLISFSNTLYRDTFRFINENAGIRVINELDIERYLYGVVGPEMGTSAGFEALKAQAVVSRSFALASRNPGNAFDVTDTVLTQVYRGYTAEIAQGGYRAVNAVNATAGEVIFFDGNLIRAYYHASSGGHTASSENVWLNPLPFLRATPSPHDAFAFNYPSQTAGGWPANTYRWELTLTRAEAQQMVDRFFQDSNDVNIGRLLNISTGQADQGREGTTLCGRVTEMVIHGTEGTGTVHRDRIRSVFGLRSTKFEVRTDSTIYVRNGNGTVVQMSSADGLRAIGRDGVVANINGDSPNYTARSAAATRQISRTFTALVFEGSGHGHGVGMSQWGARGMAASGYNYRQIIEHYYNMGNNDGRLQILNYHTRGR